jgi:hypothetical protein
MLGDLEERNMEVDNAKLEALMGRMIGELGAAINVPLMMI